MSESTGFDQPFFVGATGTTTPPPTSTPPPVTPPPPIVQPPPTGTGGATGTNTATSALVPGSYPVALGGHAYLLDLAMSPITHAPIALLKQQLDTSALPGEQSLSHDILWRRPQDSWHHGAGQSYLDKFQSDPERFRSSKGINVWTKGEMSLLQDVKKAYTLSGSVETHALSTGLHYYISDTSLLQWTIDVSADTPAFSDANIGAGETSQPVYGLATDGLYVYAALGSNGVHRTQIGTIISTHYSDTPATRIGFVRGRLLVANSGTLYNVTASGAAPIPLLTLPNMSWIAFTESQSHIYALAASAFKSYIYKTQVRADGTALDVPSVALELPDGEVAQTIVGYLGFIVIGTTRGVRLAQVGSNGDLTLGGLIALDRVVYALEPQDRFVWFGWNNYDATSTGLGRLDLSEFTAPLVPAYASDLMVTGQGNITDINTTFLGGLAFTVNTASAARGVYVQNVARKVASGTIDSGLITFGLPDPKVAFYLDVRYKSLAGTHKAYVTARDGGAFEYIGQHNATSGTAQFPVGQIKSDVFEIREELIRDAVNLNDGPIITRHTLKVEPAADTGIWITAPLLFASTDHINGTGAVRDPLAELDFIQRLRADQTLVIWQESNANYLVVVDEYQWQGMKWSDKTRNFEGTCVVKLKVIV